MGPWSLGSHGGPRRKGDRGGRHQQRGGDAVPAVPGSSESTRSYRRISGVVGKAGSAMSPQSPGGPEDPALSKVPPVPMPRRFAPVGATTRGGSQRGCDCRGRGRHHPLHPQASHLPLSWGGRRRDQGCRIPAPTLGVALGGSVTPLPTPLQAKGRQKRVKAVADCKGDKARELTFSKGEVIVVTREEDEQSWVSVTVAWTDAGVPTLVPSPTKFSSGGGWVFTGGIDGCHGLGGLLLMCRHGFASLNPPGNWNIQPQSFFPARGGTPTPLTPALCTPRSASSRATAPAPESSQPASSTSCKTDWVAVAPFIPVLSAGTRGSSPSASEGSGTAPAPGARQSQATRDMCPGPWRGTIQPGWTLASKGAQRPPHWEDSPWTAAAGSCRPPCG